MLIVAVGAHGVGRVTSFGPASAGVYGIHKAVRHTGQARSMGQTEIVPQHMGDRIAGNVLFAYEKNGSAELPILGGRQFLHAGSIFRWPQRGSGGILYEKQS